MPPTRFSISDIRNKHKRQDVYRRRLKEGRQEKLRRRLERAKAEKEDPELRKARLHHNIPKTLDNMREYDPSMLTASSQAHPQSSTAAHVGREMHPESALDIQNDPFAAYFSSENDPTLAPKVLVTTSTKATNVTYEFCHELCGIFPGAQFVRRKKGQDFQIGKIAEWSAKRGYSALLVVNEDHKVPNAITLVHLPDGPSALFKLSSIRLSKDIIGHGRSSGHHPELVLNGFVTRLGHAVGRMFQILFPPLPEFEGRQAVTLHNQRDFLFFRRHRYVFKSTEKTGLQEIGPRFTLKLRWLKKGLPTAKESQAPPELHIADGAEEQIGSVEMAGETDYDWLWKPKMEVNRRTFFL
ncbi:Brix-domain-containing protein [Dacryopinax primogenitus]|uniref:Brix-domain-containing protein n=1 Tax=Dacryopinax primogenitus (strain DJM 731) TaxID=1858805 RepID=M5G555_DACPD|nr:Brix-domain-containing protein [Dacryopinax primogenitus]EJU03799.1 Brix-domain-containing protein [Dacryopinax primogenitus]